MRMFVHTWHVVSLQITKIPFCAVVNTYMYNCTSTCILCMKISLSSLLYQWSSQVGSWNLFWTFEININENGTENQIFGSEKVYIYVHVCMSQQNIQNKIINDTGWALQCSVFMATSRWPSAGLTTPAECSGSASAVVHCKPLSCQLLCNFCWYFL
jgi:hypothetical protein